MSKTTNKIRIILVIMCLALSSAHVIAQNASAPHMPTFDEVTVRQMLDSIDEAHNFSLLRAGYFSGHRKSPFPVSNGFEVLKSTLEAQEKGSDKWFMLQALRGSAAFHTREILADEGFDAYDSLFADTVPAITPRAKATLRSAVRDLVGGTGALKRKGFLYDSRVPDLLVNAWNTWKTLPPSATDAQRPLDWGRAIAAADAQDKFTAIVEDALKDTTHAPDFAMLKLAVVVLQDTEPQRAIELLKTAQQKMEPGNIGQQKWLYETWMKLITDDDASGRIAMRPYDKSTLAQLVEMRKNQISYTGTGYADLLKLYWRLEQTDKAADIIKIAHQPGIRASEKIDVAKVLLTPPRDMEFGKDALQQMQAQGVELLEKYLLSVKEIPLNPPLKSGTFTDSPLPREASPERNANDEIRARYELGRYFVTQDMITEALQALTIDDLKPPSRNSQAGMYYTQLLKLKEQLAQKLKDVEGVK